MCIRDSHIAYLYNFTGAAYKTQAMVNRIMHEMYKDTPDGLEGNEDCGCLLYTSDAADERSSVDLGGRRIIKKNKKTDNKKKEKMREPTIKWHK